MSFYDGALGRVVAAQVRAVSACVIAGDVGGLRAFTDNQIGDADFARYLDLYTGRLGPLLRPWRPGLFPDYEPAPGADGVVHLFEPLPYEAGGRLADSAIRMTLEADRQGRVTFLNLAF